MVERAPLGQYRNARRRGGPRRSVVYAAEYLTLGEEEWPAGVRVSMFEQPFLAGSH
jgi:hypothetical protein